MIMLEGKLIVAFVSNIGHALQFCFQPTKNGKV
jgi:hypothetical protein